MLEGESMLKVEQLLIDDLHFDANFHGVNWDSYPNHLILSNSGDCEESKLNINQYINDNNSIDCYVMWDRGDLPIITINLAILIENLEMITRIAFDTWIVGVDFDILIEFHHSGVNRFTYIKL